MRTNLETGAGVVRTGPGQATRPGVGVIFAPATLVALTNTEHRFRLRLTEISLCAMYFVDQVVAGARRQLPSFATSLA